MFAAENYKEIFYIEYFFGLGASPTSKPNYDRYLKAQFSISDHHSARNFGLNETIMINWNSKMVGHYSNMSMDLERIKRFGKIIGTI